MVLILTYLLIYLLPGEILSSERVFDWCTCRKATRLYTLRHWRVNWTSLICWLSTAQRWTSNHRWVFSTGDKLSVKSRLCIWKSLLSFFVLWCNIAVCQRRDISPWRFPSRHLQTSPGRFPGYFREECPTWRRTFPPEMSKETSGGRCPAGNAQGQMSVSLLILGYKPSCLITGAGFRNVQTLK